MKEIEVKAHIKDIDKVVSLLTEVAGKGKEVKKMDQYFKRYEDDVFPAFRVRLNNGRVELNCKKDTYKTSDVGNLENNLEFEIEVSSSFEDTVNFFRNAGLIVYFRKYKTGYEWYYNSCHVEVLEVNDLGWFIEVECLIPFESGVSHENEAMVKVLDVLKTAGVDQTSIENRTYREMILGR